MSNGSTPSHGVMEGKGAYNRHATLQAAGAASALPLLVKAARDIAIDPGNGPVVIADYGSSQGKNSLAPMRAAIGTLRQRLGPHRPILVAHVDLPANDFSTLFEVLETDPDRYVLNDPNVYPCAIGRSFYGKVFPPNYVHLGWSSYAAVWLSRVPSTIPDHFWVPRSTGAVRAEFDRQGARDWEAFLSFRTSELRRGGRLAVVVPALNDDGESAANDLADHANAILAEMVHEGAITADERARMVVPMCARRKRDLLAPFAQNGQFQGLVVEHCDMSVIPDAAWTAYQRHGDSEVLATEHALFFRSTFMPTLATALAGGGAAEERRVFADRLEDGLKQRLASQPAPLLRFVGTIVVANQSAAKAGEIA